MTELLASAFGLGIAGLDPAGALIVVAALGAGARRRGVVVFAVTTIVATALIGTVLSLTVGQSLQSLDWGVLVPPDEVAAVVELAIAAGLLWWGARRLRRPGARPPKPGRRNATGSLALAGAGLLWAIAAVTDPTFLGLVVLAGREPSVLGVALAHVVWIVVSQLPLVVLTVAVLRGRHEAAVAWFQRWWARARPVVAQVLTAVLLLAGVVLAADAGWWFATGAFLIG